MFDQELPLHRRIRRRRKDFMVRQNFFDDLDFVQRFRLNPEMAQNLENVYWRSAAAQYKTEPCTHTSAAATHSTPAIVSIMWFAMRLARPNRLFVDVCQT